MSRSTLNNRVALITGGSRGIGRAIVEALSNDGVKVVACSKTGLGFDNNFPNLIFKKCDVRCYSSVVELVDFTANIFGGVDILINNAGVVHRGGVEDLTIDQWNEVISTNLSGAFYFSKAVMPHLRVRGGGHIINMSSRSAVAGFSGGAAYNASKFGLNGFTEALFLDAAPQNIKVTTIMPGRVATDFGDERPDSWQISPEDIANVVVESLLVGAAAAITKVEIRPLVKYTERDDCHHAEK